MKKPTFVEVLIKARRHIARGHINHICLAISHVCMREFPNLSHTEDMQLAARYRARIEAQLDGCVTYAQWLVRKHPRVHKRMMENWPVAFREGRLQWIDDMIARERMKGKK